MPFLLLLHCMGGVGPGPPCLSPPSEGSLSNSNAAGLGWEGGGPLASWPAVNMKCSASHVAPAGRPWLVRNPERSRGYS